MMTTMALALALFLAGCLLRMFSKAQDSAGKERRLKCELIAIVEGEQAHPMSSIGLGTNKRWNFATRTVLLCE
jgi:hypothetical protein